MDAPIQKPPFAWQPLTPRGVAAFARASLGRLLLVQFLFGLLAASSIAWCAHETWFPIIRQAISHLPPEGAIRVGRLDWRDASPKQLAEGRCLAFAVDLAHTGQVHSPAHVQFEFGERDVKIFSLFGFVQVFYPKDWIIAFNHTELGPWWGAWAPPILEITILSLAVVLMLSWFGLATLYFLPVWLIGFYGNRELSLRASWRLAGAALMPGCVFLSVAVLSYGLGVLDLVQLIVAWAMHFAIGWIYSVAGALSAPLHPAVSALKPNPFKAP
jgi:hypothetical protein